MDLLSATAVETHTSPSFTVQPSLSTTPMLSSTTPSLSKSSSRSIGPPGFSPPNDEIIEQLNSAQNFHILAQAMKLKRNFSGSDSS